MKKPKRNVIILTDKNCYICGISLVKGYGKIRQLNNFMTKDHVFPKCFNGRMKLPCCLSCNQQKGNKIFNLSFYLYILWKGGLHK